uniref:TRAF-type domain-containing protein n=1 Tax=Lotharella oceanica TaxID=641309 RepID=A0A7S2TL06_9EUKA|eukprot:CAMPEP_0170191450 /NCGR_PEP_ID=MMETSP0040_2-20121228/51758_1 /TAXON_ID=641309 /ORGANISM="Lotharella oceanica, Strain CCMP622" /LENGTH=180 /DNA_ID=CAMNT_0010439535 /DNA_START=9 /DNA_END=554 /DNA_ORIENTATION=-
MCPVCRKDIPEKSFALHEMQCARLNVWCPKCQKCIRRTEAPKHKHCEKCNAVVTPQSYDEHMLKVHGPVTCECGATMEAMRLEAHKRNECPMRRVKCKYCGILVVHLELEAHMRLCGGKSVACRICGTEVPRRKLDAHLAAVHRINPSLMQESKEMYDPVSLDIARAKAASLLEPSVVKR